LVLPEGSADVAADGSGMVGRRPGAGRAGTEKWTMEVPHITLTPAVALTYGFAPQEMRVYIDNVV